MTSGATSLQTAELHGHTRQVDSRSARFDVLRVGACLAVILLHLSATIVMDRDFLGGIHWHISNAIDAATRWCVPVFVMLSGALLLAPPVGNNRVAPPSADKRYVEVHAFFLRGFLGYNQQTYMEQSGGSAPVLDTP